MRHSKQRAPSADVELFGRCVLVVGMKGNFNRVISKLAAGPASRVAPTPSPSAIPRSARTRSRSRTRPRSRPPSCFRSRARSCPHLYSRSRSRSPTLECSRPRSHSCSRTRPRSRPPSRFHPRTRSCPHRHENFTSPPKTCYSKKYLGSRQIRSWGRTESAMSALAMALAATGMAAAAVRALSPQRQAQPPADVAEGPRARRSQRCYRRPGTRAN